MCATNDRKRNGREKFQDMLYVLPSKPLSHFREAMYVIIFYYTLTPLSRKVCKTLVPESQFYCLYMHLGLQPGQYAMMINLVTKSLYTHTVYLPKIFDDHIEDVFLLLKSTLKCQKSKAMIYFCLCKHKFSY